MVILIILLFSILIMSIMYAIGSISRHNRELKAIHLELAMLRSRIYSLEINTPERFVERHYERTDLHSDTTGILGLLKSITRSKAVHTVLEDTLEVIDDE